MGQVALEFATEQFGTVTYTPDQVIEFPWGLPAFDSEREFLPVERQNMAPVVFLQSLTRADLVFITLPVHLVDAAYRLEMSPEDLESLGLPADRQPVPGDDVLCLAIVTLAEQNPATANLLAPIVVNLKTNKALQTIQVDAGYSHQHPLPTPDKEEACS